MNMLTFKIVTYYVTLAVMLRIKTQLNRARARISLRFDKIAPAGH